MKPYKIPGTIIWFQGFNLTFYTMLDFADDIWLLSDWQQSEGVKEEYQFVIRKNAEIESRMPMESRPFVEIWEEGRLTMERTTHTGW